MLGIKSHITGLTIYFYKPYQVVILPRKKANRQQPRISNHLIYRWFQNCVLNRESRAVHKRAINFGCLTTILQVICKQPKTRNEAQSILNKILTLDTFQGREKFRIQVYLPIIDELITQLQRRSQAYDELLNLFGFFSKLTVLRAKKLEVHCQKFSEFYVNDVDGNDLLLECLHFEHHLLQEKMLGMYSSSIPIHQMYKLLKNNHLEETFPNLEIAFRIFLSLMITNASGERSFSKLKLIKNELRNRMIQERLR
ncbi:hypothetical protein RN001_006867 [Aquatica leii]|uniref:HAT C-terminal dimerisation domain-containing protein n=1 Tax=Aquatica leii TaxID=1421715 RepID=A0AAN7QLG9_9COLE|nr:hypothetical protein RN001_006867 [Aquatica leii]